MVWILWSSAACCKWSALTWLPAYQLQKP